MGDLSKNFSSSETTCKCGCGLNNIQPEPIAMLELIRAALGGSPIKINSAVRCQYHNARSGGVVAVKHKLPDGSLDLSKYPKGVPGVAGDSNHTHGTACDIVVTGMSSRDLHSFILQMYQGGKLPMLAGLGLYVRKNFCHVDTSPKLATLRRWQE